MKTIRTTPPRTVDVAAVFPELAPLARTATRLHPRPGTPTPYDSSVGGPLLWPADEPWPHCDVPHEGGGSLLDVVRLEQRARVRRAMTPDDPRAGDYTPEESAAVQQAVQRFDWDHDESELPVPLLPVAQLYARDVHLLRPPGRSEADLLQVLWCPFDHPPDQWMPRTALFWRTAADVTELLTAPPEPHVVESEEYVPVPCVLAPEQVTEYPSLPDLSKELQEQVKDWSRWEAAGARVDSGFAAYPESYYGSDLSVAPGWKFGGYSRWGYIDPSPRPCPACGTEMDPLLTIASTEGDSSQHSWIPYEDEPAATSDQSHVRDLVHRPTAIQIADLHAEQLYSCPRDPGHPHMELMQ
ncbi:hypothetical protein ACFTUC_03275 [Streptomyces sp. NPDC056944]|uniref:hypothetical protein n=1 Tax=Streptomyces sp. NPDC056944 TaxID=3345972 RepID=UPI003637A96D